MKTTIIPGTLAAVLALTACDGGVARPEVDNDAVTADPVAADLAFAREEEKLARDVYLTLFEKWHLRPHQNIASSEQTHTDRVKSTLLAYDFPDPVQDDEIGSFVNTELAALYAELVARGLQSEVASLEVGATIEDLDIRDLDRMKSRTDDPLVLSLYAALQCGSRNHLRAFTSQLAMRRVSYQPQYLEGTAYDAILAGAHEQCGR